MEKISAVIITFNEERNIKMCLDSLQGVADEIVVLDSFSSDKTEEICLASGAKFFQHAFDGHIQQKNRAITYASYDIVLSLDADEVLSDKLKQSILEAKKDWKHDGYFFNRLTSYSGKWIRHGDWYPDRKLRLFKKDKGQWGGVNPHDKYILNSTDIKYLKGDLLHYSFHSIHQHMDQINKFSTIKAQGMFKKNRKYNFLEMIISVNFKFFRAYILKLGFLDGFYGFVVCLNSAHSNFLKYVKLKEMQLEEAQKSKAD